MVKNFHIPAPWVDNVLERIVAEGNKHNRITEIYGSLQGIFPTGRPKDNANVSKEALINHFKYAKSLRIETNYLLNGMLDEKQEWKTNSLYCSYFKWIFEEVKPDIVTVSNKKLMEHLIKQYDCIRIKISAIAGVKTLEHLNSFLSNDYVRERIKGVVLHHDVTAKGRQIIASFAKQAILLDVIHSVLVNESCYQDCSYRTRHYNHVGKAVFVPEDEYFDYFQAGCLIKRLQNPTSLLDLVGFLLPETISEFAKDTGISCFKISGRSHSNDWIIKTTKAYLKGQSYTNLFDSILFTAPYLSEKFGMEIGDLIFLRSKAYFPIIMELPKFQKKDKKRIFLRKKAENLFKRGDLFISDPGSEYIIENGRVILHKEGEYLRFLKEKYLKSIAYEYMKNSKQKVFETNKAVKSHAPSMTYGQALQCNNAPIIV